MEGMVYCGNRDQALAAGLGHWRRVSGDWYQCSAHFNAAVESHLSRLLQHTDTPVSSNGTQDSLASIDRLLTDGFRDSSAEFEFGGAFSQT